MSRYILKRILLMIPVLLGVAFLIFTIMYFVPGDPARIILGSEAPQIQVNALRAQMGLDDPFFVQLLRFLKQIFIDFDFGSSYITNVRVMDELALRMPKTLILGFTTLILSMLIGIPLGMTAAIHQDGIADRLCMFIALICISMPVFWIGLIFVIVFSLELGWLPSQGVGSVAHYILPCISGCLGGIAVQARQSRSSMLEVIRSDYIYTAKAKGLSRVKVILRHALPNALIPVLTVAGSSFATLFGGSVVLETVFSIPGVGQYMLNAISNRDYPIIRSCVVILAFIFGVVMLLLDIVYAFVDPKIKAKYEQQSAKNRRQRHG